MSSLFCCSRTCNQTIEEKNNELNNNKIKLSSNLDSKKSTGNNSENIIIDRKIINEIKKTNSSNKYENIIINNNNIKNNKLISNLKKNSLSLNEKNIKNNINNNLKSYFSEDNNNNFNYKNNDNFIELNNINKILKQKSKSNNNTLQRTKTNNSKSSVNSKKIQLIELIPSNKRNKLKKSNTKDNFFNIDTKKENKTLNNSLSTIIKKNSNPLKYFYSIKKSSEEEKYDRILKAEKLIVKRINKKDYNNNIVYGKPSSNHNNNKEKIDIISGLLIKNFETNDLYVNFNNNNNKTFNNKTFRNLKYKNKNNLFNKSNNINNQKQNKYENIFDKYCNNCEKIYINLIENNLQLNKIIKCIFCGNILSSEIYNYLKKIKTHKKNTSIDEGKLNNDWKKWIDNKKIK